jgi:hypothetical protein
MINVNLFVSMPEVNPSFGTDTGYTLKTPIDNSYAVAPKAEEEKRLHPLRDIIEEQRTKKWGKCNGEKGQNFVE